MIEVDHLTKKYPGGRGIEDLTFQVEPEEVFGFLGPNGAGKTTTLRLLMGFLFPDSGSAHIKGLDTLQDRTELKRLVGYLPGELHFFDKLAAKDLLQLLIAMHGGSRDLKQRCRLLVRDFDLDIRQPIRKMSKGTKQKVGLIAVFMLNAEILLLDEPTSGLDPLMQNVFLSLVHQEQQRGATILMSSHQLDEVEKTCQRVGIIRAGRLLAIEDMARLKQMTYQVFDIRVENTNAAASLRESGLRILTEAAPWFTVAVSGPLSALWKALLPLQVSSFQQRTPDLEETFMHYYGNDQTATGDGQEDQSRASAHR